MSRLAPALRHCRRQLDDLRLAIAAERRQVEATEQAAADLWARQRIERHQASSFVPSSDQWFAVTSQRLQALIQEAHASEQRLAGLRTATIDARARLRLLEEADFEARRLAMRLRERKAQEALDDRTAARWRPA